MVVLVSSAHGAWASENLRTMLGMIDRDQWSAARALAVRSDRDTADIYEWLNLAREDESQDFSRYESFLITHATWPMTRRIRAHAERVMDDTISASRIARLYLEAEPVSARGMIAYIRALDSLGRTPEADRRLNEWFKDAGLIVTEQDDILTAFRKRITASTLQARLNNVLIKRDFSNARALARRMGDGYNELVAARIALADRAPDAAYKLARVPQSLRRDVGLLYDRLKWRRREFDDVGPMVEVFHDFPDTVPVELESAIASEQQILIYRLISARQGISAYEIAMKFNYTDRIARAQEEWFAGYVALRVLNMPGRGFQHFDRLYKLALSPNTRARAAYYAGLASAQLGYADIAAAWNKTAASFRGNFYGQIAALGVTLPSPETIEPAAGQPADTKESRTRREGIPTPTSQDQARFQSESLVRIARLMSQAGDTNRAEMMIHRLADLYAGQPGLIRLTVDLALELKLTSAAIKISRAAATDGMDFSDYVYPTLSGIGTGGIEPAFVYGIIRQESSFDVDAMSGSGALGLMQIMPATAREVARAERAAHHTGRLTIDPQHNVRLGSAYLKKLVDRFGSYALAAAAYNAGPRRVNEWIERNGDPRTGDISLVDWIERIPVYETRNYVQRVIEGTAIYRQKIGSGPSERDPLYRVR